MATAKAQQGPDAASDPWFQAHWNQWFGDQRAQWQKFLNEWQRTMGGDAGGSAKAYQQFFAQAGRQFIDLLQQFGERKAPDEAAKDWIAAMQKYFLGMMEPANVAQSQQAYAALGENMLKAGAAWFSALQGGKGPNLDPFGFAAGMPGIGYTREKQEMYAELYRRWSAFGESLNKYNTAMAKVGLEAVQKFQEYILTPPEGAPPLTSLKAVYVKWVDICEDIYARYAMTEEYTDLYGETVNALMRVRQQQNLITDEFVSEFNLPTRREIDSLHERVHALRRDNLALKKELAELKKADFKAKPAKKAAKKKGK